MGELAWVWFGLAVALGALEIATLTLAFAMVALACALAGITAVAGAPLAAQIPVAVAAALGGVLVLRPVVARHLRPGTAAPSGIAALTGATAVATTTLTMSEGQVRIDGVLWRARLAYAPLAAGSVLAGAEVTVAAVDGATVTVYPKE